MRTRDTILFGLPLAAAGLIAAFAAFVYWQLSGFESTYTAEARNNIREEAGLISAVITPLLNAGKLEEAVSFCNSFDRDTLRVTLIDAAGRVAADSSEDAGLLSNHQDREEVQSALNGTAAGVSRYSTSLDRWMIYYALPVNTAHGLYVLRAAVSTDRVSRMLDLARLNMFWALLFGGEIVLVLAVYVVRRVRRPLLALQKSVDAIAAGELDSRIEIPESGVVRDLAVKVSEMTDQLKAQLATVISERNEKNALFDSMNEAVLLLAPDGTLKRANRAAAELFGFDAANPRFDLGRCQIPELVTLAHQAMRDGTAFERELQLARGGAERSLLVRGCPLRNGEESGLLLTVTELTRLRRLESFRSDFIANVSHEIKTPLTCIIGAVEALEEEETGSGQSRELLGMLKKQSARLNHLVQDILSLAALEKMQLDPEPDFTEVNLDGVLANAVNACSVRAAGAGFDLRITGNPPLLLRGDAALLEQAVINLIENAVKYSGGRHITARLRQEGASAVIEIADDGIGIAPEHQKRIFERFYRVDKSRSRELGGTGLGLAIVKHTARLHHGTAEVHSTPGEGCVFTLILPL